ncbi:hypothetical protein CPAR01_07753 [Colletotrichum paranaense]|uniref:Uncharacterized protein n=1 Tax=Colletotrichum paranaense TaxID=1914294 RepID=A0ABQ9SIB6_9PEZI|nr:uncharacterized protein CPAR01_07753 [Colletotrichum paranaense]KAK1537640.1 hypothetical protein CPAR01_07753 [Colletotrichum paranaense]
MTKGCPGCNREIKDSQTYCVYGCSQDAYHEQREAGREAEREREREQERQRSQPLVVVNVSGGGSQQSSETSRDSEASRRYY